MNELKQLNVATKNYNGQFEIVDEKARLAVLELNDEVTKLVTDTTELNENLGQETSKLSEEIVELKEDMSDLTATSLDDNKDTLYVSDGKGNVIAKIDSDGVHSVDFITPNGSLADVSCNYEDKLYITDGQGNIVFKIDENGTSGLNIKGSVNPYRGMKLLSIGDSLSAHDKWQKWLVDWFGFTFDLDENINGKDGHKRMAQGGTATMPDSENSVYMRALDAKYYLDDTNGTIIFLYASQNDMKYFTNDYFTVQNRGAFGTINDKPYTKKCLYMDVPESEWNDYSYYDDGKPTLYSRCMGIVENLLRDAPSALLRIITPMQMQHDTTAIQTQARREMADMWIAISEKYGIKCVDLWHTSGVNGLNAMSYYSEVNNVHPTDFGYKRIAQTISSTL